MSELQLSLAPVGDAELELVDGELMTGAAAVASDIVPSPSPPPIPPALAERNLFAEADRIAGRAATASTRRQYGAIFRAFGDWLASELGRPPVVGDLDADVIAAYGRHLATTRLRDPVSVSQNHRARMVGGMQLARACFQQPDA